MATCRKHGLGLLTQSTGTEILIHNLDIIELVNVWGNVLKKELDYGVVMFL